MFEFDSRPFTIQNGRELLHQKVWSNGESRVEGFLGFSDIGPGSHSGYHCREVTHLTSHNETLYTWAHQVVIHPPSKGSRVSCVYLRTYLGPLSTLLLCVTFMEWFK